MAGITKCEKQPPQQQQHSQLQVPPNQNVCVFVCVCLFRSVPECIFYMGSGISTPLFGYLHTPKGLRIEYFLSTQLFTQITTGIDTLDQLDIYCVGLDSRIVINTLSK
jgi:hypothetical protein